MVAAAAMGVPAALLPVTGNVILFAVRLGVLVFSGTVTALIMGVALTVYLPNEVRGLSIGAIIATAGLIGWGIAPILVAWVSDLLGQEP